MGSHISTTNPLLPWQRAIPRVLSAAISNNDTSIDHELGGSPDPSRMVYLEVIADPRDMIPGSRSRPLRSKVDLLRPIPRPLLRVLRSWDSYDAPGITPRARKGQ